MSALPARRDVKEALHRLILQSGSKGITPEEAYEVLGEQFGLSISSRKQLMLDQNESHWENIVRQSRRDLVNQNVIDNSERGIWRAFPHLIRKVREVGSNYTTTVVLPPTADPIELEKSVAALLKVENLPKPVGQPKCLPSQIVVGM